MSASTFAPAAPPSTRGPLRLKISTERHGPAVDGAWWPRSGDLQDEMSDLVDHFPTWGRVARLLFSRPDWHRSGDHEWPHAIRASGRIVKIGSFPRDDTHLVIVMLSSREEVHLLVVPPDTDANTARDLMDRAADLADERTAGALLHGAQDVGQRADRATQRWDGEGGASGRS